MIEVAPRKGYLKVDIKVAAPLDSISKEGIERVKNNLSELIGKDIYLDVEVIPMRRLISPNK